MIVTFSHKQPEADNIFSFLFEPETPIDYIAGQFITLTLPHPHADDRGIRRWFTLSSAPGANLLSITTKIISANSSFKKALAQLKGGEQLEMAPPSGDFVLPEDKSRPLVFVAGGIGITPYHSMVQYLTDKNTKWPIQLLYAANSPGEIAFRKLFDALNWLNKTYIVSSTTSDWKGETGQLSGERISDLAGGFKGKLVYLSGPEPMIESFKEQLLKLGLPEEQLKTDFFPGYTQI